VANTLAFYDTATITAVNSFIGQAPVNNNLGTSTIKLFTVVIKKLVRSSLTYTYDLVKYSR
jgi:hypothetical protein